MDAGKRYRIQHCADDASGEPTRVGGKISQPPKELGRRMTIPADNNKPSCCQG